MFCEECGSPLKEEDKLCKVCGASPDEPDLQAESGSLDMQEKPLQYDTDGTQFDWNLNGFPKPRKTEDVNFDWRITDIKASEDKIPMFVGSAEAGKVIDQHSDLAEELNKYFTFDKAGEEFQKILDREYEKIKESSRLHGSHPYIENMNLADRIGLEAPEQTLSTVIAEEDSPENDVEEEPEVIWIGDLEEAEREPEPVPDTESTVEPEKGPESTKEAIIGLQEQTPPQEEEEDQESGPLWFETNEEEPELKRGVYIGKAILILIIIVLLAEAAILGIQYFLPDTEASETAKEINTIVSETLTEWKDRTVEFFSGLGSKEETGSEGPNPPENKNPDPEEPGQGEGEVPSTEPETTPATDKDSLIAAVSDCNKNIATIKANDSLTWQPNINYAVADINNSKPIGNNHWATKSNGEHVYYDREIVATLINFDSKWIDYVNGGSDAVIDLTKEGSQAQRNATSFSKVGKVEQTFQLLEIGEIRQGEKDFYVWTYEEINEVQGGRTTIKKYNWIYQLEPIDGEMKIVGYYNY